MARIDKILGVSGFPLKGSRLKGPGTRAPGPSLASEVTAATAGPAFKLNPSLVASLAAARPELTRLAPSFRPEITRIPDFRPRPLPFPTPLPSPIPRPPAAPQGVEPSTPPAAPRTNPFAELPFRSPGDRILADDFNKLSQALDQIAKSVQLSSALFGARFGQARPLLESHGYQIRRAVSVFGNAVADLHEESAADRLVVSVSLAELGAPDVDVVLSERVEGRRFVPDLRGRTYPQAMEAIRNLLADVPVPASPGPAPTLVGSTLAGLRTRF